MWPVRSNSRFLAQVLASWRPDGLLPASLGLGVERFQALVSRHFPTLCINPWLVASHKPDERRLQERRDVVRLLLDLSSHGEAEVDRLDWSEIIAQGCMGNGHLYHDLGFANRDMLNQLMATYFAPLKKLNHRNMKWKKFIYRQLCQREGIYVCRSPSCASCVDFRTCFETSS